MKRLLLALGWGGIAVLVLATLMLILGAIFLGLMYMGLSQTATTLVLLFCGVFITVAILTYKY